MWVSGGKQNAEAVDAGQNRQYRANRGVRDQSKVPQPPVRSQSAECPSATMPRVAHGTGKLQEELAQISEAEPQGITRHWQHRRMLRARPRFLRPSKTCSVPMAAIGETAGTAEGRGNCRRTPTF